MRTTLLALGVLTCSLGGCSDPRKARVEAEKAKVTTGAEKATLKKKPPDLQTGETKPSTTKPSTTKPSATIENFSNPAQFSVGQIGKFNWADASGFDYVIKISQIIDDNKMIVNLRGDPGRFVIEGQSTKGNADGQEIYLPGLWEITSTTRIGEKTVFVLKQKR